MKITWQLGRAARHSSYCSRYQCLCLLFLSWICVAECKSKALRAARGSSQTAVVDGTTLGDMGQDASALSFDESAGGQVNDPAMQADENQIPDAASVGYMNDPATMGNVNVGARAQYPQQLSSQAQDFRQQGIPSQMAMEQAQMSVSHAQQFSAVQRQEQSLLEPMLVAERDTLIGQQKALQASMQEQNTLATREKGLEVQLAEAERRADLSASQSRYERQTAVSSSTVIPRRHRHGDDNNDDSALTLNEDKMSTSLKNLILIVVGILMVFIMVGVYRFSENNGEFLQPYSPVSAEKKQELWEKSRRRALQLFGGWPADTLSPKGLGPPGPPPNPAVIEKSPGQSSPAYAGRLPGPEDSQMNRVQAHYNVSDDVHGQTYSWYVNVMWDVIYRNEINLYRANQLKRRTTAFSYVSMISQTIVFTLIPLQGNLGSDLVDNILKVAMMVMSLTGVLLRGIEETFQLRSQSQSMMTMAMKQEELYQTLAVRQDEFAQFFEPDSDDEPDPYVDGIEACRKFRNGYIELTPDMYFAAMNHFLEKYEEERHKATAAMMKMGGNKKGKGKKPGQSADAKTTTAEGDSGSTAQQK